MKFTKPDDRERLVRAVLAMEPETVVKDAVRQLGIHRSTFNRIRHGQMYADTLPELPRLTTEQTRRSCEACVHWSKPKEPDKNPCGLGFPECKQRGRQWARMCSCFKPAGMP
jgi:hypothetical protein